MDGRLADDPQAPLAAEHHLPHAGPGGGAGHRAGGQHARRRGHAHGPGEVGHVAVLVGLHARRAGGDPAAERRVGEAVGEVAERPAPSVQLLLEVGPEHARLDPGEAGSLVHVQHAVHAGQVDGDDSAGLALRGLEAAGDVAAAAEGDQDRVGLERGTRRRPPPPPRSRGGQRGRAAGRRRRFGGAPGPAGSCRGRAPPGRRRRRRPPVAPPPPRALPAGRRAPTARAAGAPPGRRDGRSSGSRRGRAPA